jgi:hypothetical protein
MHDETLEGALTDLLGSPVVVRSRAMDDLELLHPRNGHFDLLGWGSRSYEQRSEPLAHPPLVLHEQHATERLEADRGIVEGTEIASRSEIVRASPLHSTS